MEPGSAEHRRAWLTILCQAVQRIALEPAAQIAQYPSYIAAADEMALDFDHALEVCRGLHYIEGEVLERLSAIARLLESMSGPAQEARWTHIALVDDLGWQQARTMAREALRAAGWPEEAPPPETAGAT